LLQAVDEQNGDWSDFLYDDNDDVTDGAMNNFADNEIELGMLNALLIFPFSETEFRHKS